MSHPLSYQYHQSFTQQQNGMRISREVPKQHGPVRYESTDESENESCSDSEYSEFSDEIEPLWQEEPMPAGELFYVEDLPSNENANNNSHHMNGGVPQPLHAEPPRNGNQENEGVTMIKIVYVAIKSALEYEKHTQTSLLASMLGIITLDSKVRNRRRRQPVNQEKIVVDALVPGGATIRSGKVAVGDVLTAINDECVVASNVEHFLKMFTHPCRLKLTFQRDSSSHAASQITGSDHQQESSVQLLSPSKQHVSQSYALDGPHGVFYLTLSVHSDTAGENDDILYAFPTVETTGRMPSKLVLIRGLFVTLSDVIRDTFHGNILSSSVVIGSKMVHCVYHFVNTEVFVICIPAECYSLPQAQRTMADAVRLLTVMYGSVASAFQPENRQRLDHLFRFMLLLNVSSESGSSLFQNITHWKLHGTSYLRLSPDLTAHANAALAELEACDFEDGSSNHSYIRRLYTVRGSCVFYDGHLVVSHLPSDDLNDLTLFCHNHCLLGSNQKERIGLLLIWREVFPWSETQNKEGDKSNYSKIKGRCFWMIVGLKHSLLCTLLHLNSNLFPSSHTPRPDPLYVNKARATLLNLETCHFQDCVRQRLQTTSHPPLVDSNTFLSQPSGSLFKSSKPPTGKQQRGGKFPFSSPLKSKHAEVDLANVGSASSSPQKLSKSGKGAIPASENTPPSLVRGLFRDKSFSSQGSFESTNSGKALGNAESAYSLEDIGDAINSALSPEAKLYDNVTVGPDNTLFCYLTFDELRGILIVPTEHDLGTVGSAVQKEVVSNFQRHVLCLHQRLTSRAANDDECIEEGILFQCAKPTSRPDPKAKSPFLQYWVVGRVVQKPARKEVYVCFHNSAPQCMIELAFRMF